MTTADEWFAKGMADVGLSRSADTHSEYVGDLRRAVAHFDQALGAQLDHLGALTAKAHALSALDDHEGALDAFVAASHLAPHDPDLQRGAGQALQRLGRREEALGAFEAVLERQPEDPEALFQRAELLTRLGRDEAAIVAWDVVLGRGATRELRLVGGQQVRVLTSDFRRHDALLGRALAVGRLGRPETRASFLDAFEAIGDGLDGMSPRPFFLEALRSLELAREAYRAHVVARRASHPSAEQRAADVWFTLGRLDEALATWDAVLARAPGDSRAWFSKAEVLARRGELDAAIAAFERSLALEPDFLGAKARLRVVRAEAEAGRRDE